jgi:hypothetical protein
MSVNVITAIINVVKNPYYQVADEYRSINRANGMGDALEYFVKDSFCGIVGADETERVQKYSSAFSYLGNQNNPPDFIVKGGDAVEVKKLESAGNALALNSSFPKNKLFKDDPKITNACRECETWDVKDLIYSVGVVNSGENNIKLLWFVYGDVYASERDVYERIKDTIQTGIGQIPGVEFAETDELGKVKKVDPLGITDLRIRGMWSISNPLRVFDYITEYDSNSKFTLIAIIPKDKYASFPEENRRELETLNIENLAIADAKVKNPNNPANLMDVVLIKFSVSE